MSMIFQRQYSTNTLLKCLRYQLCCFLLHRISVSPSSSYSWTWWLTWDWRNQHHPHDCSFPSSNLSCLRAKRLWYRADWFHVQTMSVVSPSSTPNLASWILSWLAVRARPPAHMCRHDISILSWELISLSFGLQFFDTILIVSSM